MCFMGWLYELLSIVSIIMTPFLVKHGIANVHFIDAIIMFLVIPFLHLMNDDDTKAIIYEENWYQGIRHILGVYTEKVPQSGREGPPSGADPTDKSSPSSNESSKHLISVTSSQHRLLGRRCNSASSILPTQTLEATERHALLQRRYSLRSNVKEQQVISFQDPITIYLIKSIKAKTTCPTTTMAQSNFSNEGSRKGSMTSIHTLYLDR